VIGGGIVGAAVAFGLREAGPRLAWIDDGSDGPRASRGNFGLVWVQGKGQGCAPYANWTLRSAREWPAFASSLRQASGIDVAHAQAGGLSICLSRAALDARVAMLDRLLAQPGCERYDVQVLDREALARRLPGIGPDVAGGTWCAQDGHCNPLRLGRAMWIALRALGVECIRQSVISIEHRDGLFVLTTPHGQVEASRVVLAAGLGNARLAPMVGLSAPVTPEQGQVVVLDRASPFLPFPTETIRQTDDGTVLLGDSQQHADAGAALDMDVAAAIARRAVAVLPALRELRVLRAWAAHRVMTPDGLPIYAQSRSLPGAFVVACHSGVTLAAAHARVLAPAILAGQLPEELRVFDTERLRNVRAAA